jgi:hypothetical protein
VAFIPRIRSIEELTATATNDLLFQLTGGADLWLEFADIWVKDNPAYFGTSATNTADCLAEDVYTIPYPVNVADLFFKNYTAGSNTRIILIGTPLTQKRADFYGLNITIK